VEHTGRQLKIKTTEYRNHHSLEYICPLCDKEHRLQFGYAFNWKNIVILDKELCYNKRLISELLLGVQLRFRRFPIHGFSGKW